MIRRSFTMSELDAGIDIHLGDIHLAIGTLSDEVKELRKDMRDMADDLDLNGSVVYNSTAGVYNFIDLGHPMAGKKWNVRGMAIGGSDITQTPAGVAWVLVQAVAPTTNPAITTVADWTKAALPQNSFYGKGEITVRQMEHLYVLILGGTNAVEYVASAAVQSFPEWRTVRP
jgi:hypothetical protein